MAELTVRRRLAAILAADIAGYSRLMGQDEAATVRELKAHQAAVLPLVAAYDGRIIDTAGDGIFAEFASVTRALECALEVQRVMAGRNRDVPADRRMEFRIGINFGDIIHDDTRIFGDSINIAARLEGIAQPGGICISSKVRNEVANTLSLRLTDLGLRELKNIADPVHVYAVEAEASPGMGMKAPGVPAGAHGPRGEPLIGRSAELTEIRQAIERHRLVTIVGPGGIGKTRLAAALRRFLESENEVTTWAELAPLSDPDLAVHAIGEAIGLQLPEGGSDIAHLAHALRPRTLTLFLDNAEHLVDRIAAIANALLQAAPRLRVVVTSRTPLKLPFETTFRLEGLTVPAGPLPAVEAAAFGAIALFCTRAHAAARQFQLSEDNCRAIIELCRRLDGMPLAIEFAAARVPALGVGRLLEQLSQRLGALSADSSVAPARHQTLRATLDWSYALLSQPEQQLFSRLGVFAGGFTLEGVHALAEGMPADEWTADDLLRGLVDKSMVVVDAARAPARYALLDTSRAYALEKLHVAGVLDEARRAHAGFFAALLDETYEAWFVGPESQWRARIWHEIDNVSSAISWAIGANGDRALAIRLAGTVVPIFLAGRQRRAQARAFVDAALQLVDGEASARTTARLLVSKGMLTRLIDRPAAQAAFEQAITLYRQAGDRRGVAHALLEFARSLTGCGDLARAEDALDAAQAALRELHAPMLLGLLSMNRGYVRVMSGRPKDAVVEFKRSIEQYEAAKATTRVVQALSDVADALWACEELDEAEASFREVIRRGRESTDPQTLAVPLINLAGVLVEKGRLDEAASLAREGLSISDTRWTALPALALRLALLGRYAASARVYGRCMESYAAAKHQMEPNETRLCRYALELLRENLTADEVERLVREGRMESEDAACDAALEV